MSTYYEVYCEAMINGSWQSIDFHMLRTGDKDVIIPVASGTSVLGGALQDLGVMDDISYNELSPTLKKKITDSEYLRLESIDYTKYIAPYDFSKPDICGYFNQEAVNHAAAGDEFAILSAYEYGDCISPVEYARLKKKEQQGLVYMECMNPEGARYHIRQIQSGVRDRIRAYEQEIEWLEGEHHPDGPIRLIVHKT